MKFEDLSIISPILKALAQKGYTQPTPIQMQAIPPILTGRDLVGCAQTGTGKTAAFSIPLLQVINRGLSREKNPRAIKALILTPTRELAVQIGESLGDYGKGTPVKHTVIFGGVSQIPQEHALRRNVDILVATPGRLLDLMNQGLIDLRGIQHFVLDEADRMLDMGFFQDVKRVIGKLPPVRQNLLFSATMPADIQKLANTILSNPVKVEANTTTSAADEILQYVYFVERQEKRILLIELLQDPSLDSVLVFTRTKHGADKVVRDLAKARIIAEAIHGNKSQNTRQRALNNFKDKRTRVLVATDIAARGIDVQALSHVINYDLPNIPETYVHRIGRTGRAGLSGIALSFCDQEERDYLKDIQKLIAKRIAVLEARPMRRMIPSH